MQSIIQFFGILSTSKKVLGEQQKQSNDGTWGGGKVVVKAKF